MIQVVDFGVRRVVAGEQTLRDQSWRAHKYYNALIEIERRARAGYRAIRSKYVPGLVECDAALAETTAQIEDVYDAIRLERKRLSAPKPPAGPTPTKVGPTPEQEAQLEQLRRRRKELAASAKALRANFAALIDDADREFDRRTNGISRELAGEIDNARAALKALDRKDPGRDAAKARLDSLLAQKRALSPSTHKKGEANRRVLDEMLDEEWPEAWKELARLNANKLARSKAARAECGLSTGTYQAVEDAVQTACKTATVDPDFRRWAGGEGARKVGLQLTGDVRFGAVLAGSCRRVQILERARTRHLDSVGNRASAESWHVQLDLGKELEPVVVEIAGHRRIPETARLRWVYLVPRRNKWKLQFTVELERPLIERAPGRGLLRVEFRWSLADRGIIVAVANGQPILVPNALVEGLDNARRLQGYADTHFEAARGALRSWIDREGAPDWMASQVEHLAKWRAHGKLAAISLQWLTELDLRALALEAWRAWRDERLSARLDLFAPLAECEPWLSRRGITGERAFAIWLDLWRRKDLHLQRMASGRRARMLAQRRDLFRSVAAKLSTTYEHIEFGELEIARAARRKTPDRDQNELHQAARRQRVVAAPGELKECLMAAFRGRERSGASDSAGTARATKNMLEER